MAIDEEAGNCHHFDKMIPIISHSLYTTLISKIIRGLGLNTL